MVSTVAPGLDLDRAALDRARSSRDPRFDGRFFIGVRSTRIYCRPICPAPAPKTTNITYYPSAAAAAEAGLRPCLRCRPEAAPGTPAWLGTSAVVRRALRLINEGALDTDSVEDLASRLGVGPRHLGRLFAQHVGASPLAVAQTRRLHFAKRLIDDTNLSMTEIALAAGFGSLRRFNDAFKQTYQRAPSELRERRRGAGAAEAEAVVLRLAYRPPYDWSQVHAFLATRAIPGVERVDATGYARTVALGPELGSGPALITVRPVADADALELVVQGAPPAALFQLSSTARRMFDLAADPARISTAFSSDALLAPLVRATPGLRIPGAWDPFECAVRAVLGQQVSVAAARTLAMRLVARHGTPLAVAQGELTHLFPGAATLAGADLDGLGLTGARVTALRALATAVADGTLDFSAAPEEVVHSLVQLPGIGEWTAQYLALRALGEPDAFPAGDLVLKQRAGAAGKPLTEKQLLARAEAWRPWRGYAVLHLWRSTNPNPLPQEGGRARSARGDAESNQESSPRALRARPPSGKGAKTVRRSRT
jgi:AraC family transcriptional regulator of adaptative response / DNA-3-methyladenine glycosylase II